MTSPQMSYTYSSQYQCGFNSSCTTEIPNWNCSTAEPQPQLVIPARIVLGILIVLVMIICIGGNSVVCLIVYQKRAMRSAINLLLANMALCNILLAVSCMPFALVTVILNGWAIGVVMCRLVAFFHLFFVCEAGMILLTISVDRYLIIVKRLDKLTPYRARLIIVLTWVFSFVMSFPPTVGWGLYQYHSGWLQCILREAKGAIELSYLIISSVLVFFLPMLVMIYIYLRIINSVRKNLLRIHSHPENVAMTQVNRLGLVVNYPPRVNMDISSKTRAFKTILIIFIIYLCCWIPYSVCLLTWNLQQELHQRYIGGCVVIFLGYLNGALNPLVYCWRIKKFREACKDILPNATKLTPSLPTRVKRKINPGAVYEMSEVSTAHPQYL